jgi:hypothetical protein
MAKCQFRKKNGCLCRANAQPENGTCVFHDPARAEEGKRARSAGGVNRNRPAMILSTDTPDHPLASPNDVSELLAQSINQLRRAVNSIFVSRTGSAIWQVSSFARWSKGRWKRGWPIWKRFCQKMAAGPKYLAFDLRKEVVHE